jgi:caffeoyl-CoA O-methyltransferase
LNSKERTVASFETTSKIRGTKMKDLLNYGGLSPQLLHEESLKYRILLRKFVFLRYTCQDHIPDIMKNIHTLAYLLFFTCFMGLVTSCYSQTSTDNKELDERVKQFLEENKRQWRDLNIPYEDGKVLFDLIVNNNYQSALEIGTSTGHSTIWIAWALSKTGGKVITLEIDKSRQKEAIVNIEKLGLSAYVEFRLGDAHQMVKDLKGQFDFVFSDADKDWYTQYFKDIHPKLKKGGRFTAHNVLMYSSGIREFMEYINNHPEYQTSIDRSSSSGISISLKK